MGQHAASEAGHIANTNVGSHLRTTKMLGLFKRQNIQITNKLEFEMTLTRLIELLRDNGFKGQANVVRQLLGALTRDNKDEFIKIITSVDMWGGAGAVWEVYGFTDDKDEKDFWRQLIKLTDQMKDIGIECNHAYSTADIFRKELKKIEK